MCVRLFKEGWFETDVGEGFDLKLSRMKKEVVIGPEDVKEVDNDFFLVVVKIVDHQDRTSDDEGTEDSPGQGKEPSICEENFRFLLATTAVKVLRPQC
ncbi:hypothetical protein IFM89_024085 [Coptis chinensis]|uniref:Uncharacterized protein n=1 Tax=Coptis chinensis TaxID=261450 RepID=A0A835LWZ8_9MAGN|nr:hypothetical protein IFM89_024085 [Coptis chinensis]